MKAAILPDRGVIKVTGDAARQFLNGLFTADLTKVSPERPCYAALLTPQGKIVVDCIVVEQPDKADGFLLDCPRALVGELVEKLTFYRLRAKVTFEDLSHARSVLAFWDGTGRSTHGLVYPDPRLPELGGRMILPPERTGEAAAELGAELVTADAYEAHRIALGVPRGGIDFAYGDAFPHEADMDQLNGVDFAKGCFVGQEVVARIEHRGSARKRIVQVTAEGFAPEAGLPVMAGERAIGNMGSAAGAQGLAMLRLDHLAEAEANGVPIIAGGVRLYPRKPAWARFDWPQKAAE